MEHRPSDLAQHTSVLQIISEPSDKQKAVACVRGWGSGKLSLQEQRSVTSIQQPLATYSSITFSSVPPTGSTLGYTFTGWI